MRRKNSSASSPVLNQVMRCATCLLVSGSIVNLAAVKLSSIICTCIGRRTVWVELPMGGSLVATKLRSWLKSIDWNMNSEIRKSECDSKNPSTGFSQILRLELMCLS